MKKPNLKLKIRGPQRLGLLVSLALGGAIVVVIVANNYIDQYGISDVASRATIVASVFTFLGIVFTTINKEISSYYKDKTDRATKRWNLVFPLITDYYMSWIYSASSLIDALKDVPDNNIPESQLDRIIYLISVFYGNRLRFIIKKGGYILLSSTEEEKKVASSYNNIKKVFNWAGIETPNRVSELQKLFLTNTKSDEPYTLIDFESDLKKSTSLQDSKAKLKAWLTKDNAEKTSTALQEFVDIFKKSIDNLSAGWDT